MGAVASGVGFSRGTGVSKGLQAGKLWSSLRDDEQAGVGRALERGLLGAHLPYHPSAHRRCFFSGTASTTPSSAG